MNSSLSANKAPYQNSNSSTSTLRPRNTRLISYLDEDASSPAVEDSSASAPKTSSFPAHGVSPLPSLRRPRSVAHSGSAVKTKQAHTRSPSESSTVSPTATLWDSWSSISGIASTLLGSDVQLKNKDGDAFKTSRRKNDNTVSKNQSSWGPASDSGPQLASGSLEERQAIVQAKRREALLIVSANEGRDANGRYKRRDSNSDFSRYRDSAEQEEDGLVYVHKIQPHDTLAGVTIKYSCQPEVFRKVNRFWPNDNIQTRKYVLLPVDACSIRGQRVDSTFDLLSSELENVNINHASSSTDYLGATPITPNMDVTSSELNLNLSPSSLIEDSKHESWVSLPGFPKPTEILRLPRRTLGYFPPPRRKSITYPSNTSTPKSSFDVLRHPPTHAASLNASPVRRPLLNPNSRQRSSSSTVTTSRPLTFADHLKGPGGVGNLTGLRTEASRPGPGIDPLNRKFAQYLPDLAPPEDFPRVSLRPTPRGTPRASTDSIRSTSSTGLGEVGGAIEGWVRKFAAPKTSKAGPVKMGDLIELETNSEMGDLVDDDNEDSGQMRTPTATSASVGGSGAQTTATEEALLNERFPVRGRVRNAYAGARKDTG